MSFLFSGLVYKKMENYEEALDCFLKLHAILRNNPQVIWQLANMYPCFFYNSMKSGFIFVLYCSLTKIHIDTKYLMMLIKLRNGKR